MRIKMRFEGIYDDDRMADNRASFVFEYSDSRQVKHQRNYMLFGVMGSDDGRRFVSMGILGVGRCLEEYDPAFGMDQRHFLLCTV